MKAVTLPFLSEQVLQPGESTKLVINSIPDVAGLSVLVIGSGAGLIPISLAAGGADVTACDINPKATALTEKNASALGVTLRVETNSYSHMTPPTRGWDLIVANPPQQPTGRKGIGHNDWESQAHDGGEYGITLISGILEYLNLFGSNESAAYLSIFSFLRDDLWASVATDQRLIFRQVSSMRKTKGAATRAGMRQNPGFYAPDALVEASYKIRIFRFERQETA